MHTRHVSPSQINTHAVGLDPASACVRRWGFSRIRPRHETDATKFGHRFHKVHEAWQLTKTPPDASTPEGRAALESLPYLPHPGSPGLEIEKELHFLSDGEECFEFEPIREGRRMRAPWEIPVGWVWYHGFVDIFDRFYKPGTVRIVDHKSTGDLKNADRKDLKVDPQRVIYAFHGVMSTGADASLAQWQYTQRRGKIKTISKCHEESAVVTRRRFKELHNKYALPVVRDYGRMPLELPPNVHACGAFGGCPFRGECHPHISHIGRLLIASAEPKELNKMSLMDDLKNSMTGPAVVAHMDGAEAHEREAVDTYNSVKKGDIGNMSTEQYLAWLGQQGGRFTRVIAHIHASESGAAAALPAVPPGASVPTAPAAAPTTSIAAAAPDTGVNPVTGKKLPPKPEQLRESVTPEVVAEAETLKFEFAGTAADKKKKVLAAAAAAGSIREACEFIEANY